MREKINPWKPMLYMLSVPIIVITLLVFVVSLNSLDSNFQWVILVVYTLGPGLLVFFGWYILPILEDKFKPFRLNFIRIPYIDIERISPSMELPKIKDIELAYYMGGHAWIVQDSRIIVQTYVLKWIQDGYLEQVNNLENKDSIKLIIKKNIKTDSVPEKELFNIIKEMATSDNFITTSSIDEWMIKNRQKITKWFELLYSNCYQKAIDTFNLKRYNSIGVSGNQEIIAYTKQLMALNNYLSEYSTMEKREPVEVHLWNEYMLYASLFGITDKVESKLRSICPENINYDREKNGMEPLRELGLKIKKARVNIRKITRKSKI